eukprot:3059466-Pyramimonas_sp.AAC.1
MTRRRITCARERMRGRGTDNGTSCGRERQTGVENTSRRHNTSWDRRTRNARAREDRRKGHEGAGEHHKKAMEESTM